MYRRSFCFWIITVVLLFGTEVSTAQNLKPVVYLIPGQGADARLYKNIKIDSTFEVRNIKYVLPGKGWRMQDYAKELAKQIDTTRAFILVGVSLGGMLATEIGDFLNPEKIILISSAKSRKELPVRYRFQIVVPLYKLFPGIVLKGGAQILQPVVEPDRKAEKETFKAMLKDKDPSFFYRTIKMIMEWDRKKYREDIIHIHGEKDHTIPIRNVKYDYKIEDGSHMMILTKADEISLIVNQIIRAIYD